MEFGRENVQGVYVCYTCNMADLRIQKAQSSTVVKTPAVSFAIVGIKLIMGFLTFSLPNVHGSVSLF